ncbi:MAG: hypothetical protein P4M05_16100 [Bradyrhizobium sp.]|nr:hypothetical protein [Bradyrhizobium sp.]
MDQLLRVLNATEEERASWAAVERAEEAVEKAIVACREPDVPPVHSPRLAPGARVPSTHPTRTFTRPTVGQLARAQTFRFLTMIATWVLIFAAFVYHPEWLRDSLRFMSHSIESLADQVPEPWGARLEIMLRELGGYIWIQIATAIVLLRLIVWVPFHIWRLLRERGRARQARLPQ